MELLDTRAVHGPDSSGSVPDLMDQIGLDRFGILKKGSSGFDHIRSGSETAK